MEEGSDNLVLLPYNIAAHISIPNRYCLEILQQHFVTASKFSIKSQNPGQHFEFRNHV